MLKQNAFWFLFADKNDIYFTEHLLMLDFERYLNYQLQKNGYNENYYFRRENGQYTEVYCDSEEVMNKYSYKTSFLNPILPARVEEDGRVRWMVRQRTKTVQATIISLIKDTKNDHFAFIFDKGHFAEVIGNDCIKLTQCLNSFRHDRGSIIVLTEETDDCGRLPILPSCVMTEEMIAKINASSGLLYARLLENASKNVLTWLPFENRQIYRMTERVFLSHRNADIMQIRCCQQYLCTDAMQQQKIKVLGQEFSSRSDLLSKMSRADNFRKFLSVIEKGFKKEEG